MQIKPNKSFYLCISIFHDPFSFLLPSNLYLGMNFAVSNFHWVFVFFIFGNDYIFIHTVWKERLVLLTLLHHVFTLQRYLSPLLHLDFILYRLAILMANFVPIGCRFLSAVQSLSGDCDFFSPGHFFTYTCKWLLSDINYIHRCLSRLGFCSQLRSGRSCGRAG